MIVTRPESFRVLLISVEDIRPSHLGLESLVASPPIFDGLYTPQKSFRLFTPLLLLLKL